MLPETTSPTAELRVEELINNRGGQVDQGAAPDDTGHRPEDHVGPPPLGSILDIPDWQIPTYAAASQLSFNQHLDSGIRLINQGSTQIIDLPPVYTED